MTWAMITIVLPFIIGMMEEVFKKLILVGKMPVTGWPGWRGVFYTTVNLHALVIGSAFGFLMFKGGIPWPTDVFGTNLGSAVLAGTFAGGVAMVAYNTIVGTIKNIICHISLKSGNSSDGDSQ